MSARLILHIITTIVLLAVGCWLYMRMQENAYDSIDENNVAIYWFASLVYIFFSWIFYWIVHRLKLKAWVIAQILALVFAAVATVSLLYISREYQQQLEEKAMQKNEAASAAQGESVQDSANGLETDSEDKLETLNLSEEVDIETDQEVE
jgi:thiol:disulfide interchange protein